jgi:hypothetical protein
MVGGANPTAAIDEGIEHHVEKLAAELECGRLGAGRGLSGEL